MEIVTVRHKSIATVTENLVSSNVSLQAPQISLLNLFFDSTCQVPIVKRNIKHTQQYVGYYS